MTLRKRLLIIGLIVLGVWLMFFDSHSLLQRIRWEHELSQLEEENARLEETIVDLERKLGEVEAEALIEQIAREQYGMRRPGETVYRIEAQ